MLVLSYLEWSARGLISPSRGLTSQHRFPYFFSIESSIYYSWVARWDVAHWWNSAYGMQPFSIEDNVVEGWAIYHMEMHLIY